MSEPRTVAALYVAAGGCYCDLPGVDPWPESRDARLYAGPHPVVAHPPCARWGRFAEGSPNCPRGRFTVGDDGGCFESALADVRRWGGVLEHPAHTKAWAAFGLIAPPAEGWSPGDFDGGWTCQVEQDAYGFPGRKATWLYVYGVEAHLLPWLTWGRAPGDFTPADGNTHQGLVGRLSRRKRAATPPEFRDLLLGIARSANAAPR